MTVQDGSTDTSKRRPGRPYSGGSTPTRSMRLGDVYERAMAKAHARGETIAAVVERKLAEYLDEEEPWACS